MAILIMDFMDARMVLGAIVDDMFGKYFPDLKLDGKMHGIVFELYLDFVRDKTGYWTAVKTACLITGQLNLREKKATPLHTAKVVIDWAIKSMELMAEEHKNNNKVIQCSLPDPEINRFFLPSDASPGAAEGKPGGA